MNTYLVHYDWKERNNAVYKSIQHDYTIYKDVKTPAEAVKRFYADWTSKNNGYKITSVVKSFGDGPNTFYPKKYSNKNWS